MTLKEFEAYQVKIRLKAQKKEDRMFAFVLAMRVIYFVVWLVSTYA